MSSNYPPSCDLCEYTKRQIQWSDNRRYNISLAETKWKLIYRNLVNPDTIQVQPDSIRSNLKSDGSHFKHINSTQSWDSVLLTDWSSADNKLRIHILTEIAPLLFWKSFKNLAFAIFLTWWQASGCLQLCAKFNARFAQNCFPSPCHPVTHCATLELWQMSQPWQCWHNIYSFKF